MARAKDHLPAGRPELYEQDFALWLEEQVGHLRSRAFDRLDLEHLIEELEGMRKSEKRSLNSNMVVILKHLLKCQLQPARRSRSWLSSIVEHRRRLLEEIEDSPSLMSHVAAAFMANYASGRRQAIIETGLSAERFPEVPPWTLEQVLDADFLPGQAG